MKTLRFRAAGVLAVTVLAVLAIMWLSGGSRAPSGAEVPAGAAARFSGYVRSPAGAPLSAAAVHAVWVPQDGDPRSIAEAPAETSGEYALAVDVPAEPGLLLLLATAPYHETAGRRVEVSQRRQNFTLPEGGARVTLRVRDAAGQRVPNASVLLSVESLAGDPQAAAVLTATTPASGDVTFEAIAGASARLHWTARARGRGSASGTQEKGWGHAPVAIDAVLRAGATLTGTALEDRLPAASVTIAIREANGAWGDKVRTGPGGAFALEEVPTGVPLLLSILSDDHMLANGMEEMPLFIPALQRRYELKVELRAAGTLDVRVNAASGPPLAGVDVEATPADHRMTSRKLGVTDREGKARIGGLRSDTPWRLEARHPDYAPAFADDVRPSRDGAPVQITLLRGGAIAGTVFREGGGPVGSVEIYAQRVQRSGTVIEGLREHAMLRTGEDGRFRIDHLTPGPVRVELRARARMAWSPVAAQARDVVVEEGGTAQIDFAALPQSGSLHAELGIRGDARETAAEVSFMRAAAQGAPHTVVAQRAADGTIRIDDLEPGEYEVTVRLIDHGSAQAAVTIESGRTAEARFEYAEDRSALQGTILHSDGTPAGGAQVEVYSEAGGSQKTYPIGGRAPDNLTGNRVLTRDDGTFSVAGLTPGSYTIGIRHPGEAPYERRIDVLPGRDPIQIRFPPPAHCHVKIVDADGKPMPDHVVVMQSGLPMRHTTSAVSDALGVARFDLLPAGAYTARAVVPGQPTETCAVDAGQSSEVTVHAQPAAASR